MVEQALEKWSGSADAWIETMRRGDVNRERLLDAPMLTLAGDVDGREVLDVGCGEGRFCRMLAQRGARTVGLEPTERLAAEARRLHPEGEYIRGVAENLPFENDRFDLVVTYLTLIDIADFRKAIAEMARVTRAGGKILMANLQSYATTRPTGWIRDEKGTKIHFALDHYFEERSMLLEWNNLSIINWHRPFEAYMQAFLAQDLVLEEFREPRPNPEDVAAVPSMMDEYRVPLFHVLRWRKP